MSGLEPTVFGGRQKELKFFEQKLNQKPLCILDDVLSELDAERAERLLDELSRTGQCFVTLTGLESWPKNRRRPASIFRVSPEGVEKIKHDFVPGEPAAALPF